MFLSPDPAHSPGDVGRAGPVPTEVPACCRPANGRAGLVVAAAPRTEPGPHRSRRPRHGSRRATERRAEGIVPRTRLDGELRRPRGRERATLRTRLAGRSRDRRCEHPAGGGRLRPDRRVGGPRPGAARALGLPRRRPQRLRPRGEAPRPPEDRRARRPAGPASPREGRSPSRSVNARPTSSRTSTRPRRSRSRLASRRRPTASSCSSASSPRRPPRSRRTATSNGSTTGSSRRTTSPSRSRCSRRTANAIRFLESAFNEPVDDEGRRWLDTPRRGPGVVEDRGSMSDSSHRSRPSSSRTPSRSGSRCLSCRTSWRPRRSPPRRSPRSSSTISSGRRLRLRHGAWSGDDLDRIEGGRSAAAEIVGRWDAVLDDPDSSPAQRLRALGHLGRSDERGTLPLDDLRGTVEVDALLAGGLAEGRLDEAAARRGGDRERRPDRHGGESGGGRRRRTRLAAGPDPRDFEAMLDLLSGLRQRVDRVDPRPRLLEGRLLLERGNAGEGSRGIHEATALNPRAAEAWLSLGLLAARTFDFDGGERARRRSIGSPTCPGPGGPSIGGTLIRARAALVQNDPDLAAELLDHCSGDHPNQPDAHGPSCRHRGGPLRPRRGRGLAGETRRGGEGLAAGLVRGRGGPLVRPAVRGRGRGGSSRRSNDDHDGRSPGWSSDCSRCRRPGTTAPARRPRRRSPSIRITSEPPSACSCSRSSTGSRPSRASTSS